MAVGGPGAAAVLLGANRLLPGRTVLGQRRHAAVHRLPARRLRADDRWAGLPAGSRKRRLQDEYRCSQRHLGAHADAGQGRADPDRAGGAAGRSTPSPTRAISSPRVLSDLFWMGRYAERAENMARLLIVTRERYHEFRYRQDMEGSECVPVLLAAIGQITGTDTGAGGDDAETSRRRQSHAVVADRRSAPPRIAGAIGRTPRLWRRALCATRCPTTPGWCWRRWNARSLHAPGRRRESQTEGDAFLSSTQQPDAGRHARPVRGGRRVHGARRRLEHDGHRQTDRAWARTHRTAACDA